MKRDLMRYDLHIDMLERDAGIGDERAIELLRGEFALAQNAGRFDAVTGDHIAIGAVTRSTPQEGVTRYAIELRLTERAVGLDDERAEAVLQRAFTDALNASYFLRLTLDDDLMVTLLERQPADAAPVSVSV